MGTVSLHWVKQLLFVASDSNGHSFTIGRMPNEPLHWSGVKPSDLMLLSAAACATWDLVEILTKQREPLRDLQVLCSGENLSDPPYTFTKIHIHYMAYGPVNPEKLEKAIQLSEDKYCSVISTLRLGIPVTSDFEICP